MTGWPWLAAILVLVIYEWYALTRKKVTLSRMMRDAAIKWPLLPFVAGLAGGILAAHFWWPWCPPCP